MCEGLFGFALATCGEVVWVELGRARGERGKGMRQLALEDGGVLGEVSKSVRVKYMRSE